MKSWDRVFQIKNAAAARDTNRRDFSRRARFAGPRRMAADFAFAFLAAITLALAMQSPANAAPEKRDWRLVWSDEFNQPDGSAPDPAKWVYDLGGSGWGNRELETYTARPQNARIERGCLVIEARREDFTGPDGRLRYFTSARLKTQGKASWTYGRIEARIQVPAGQGMWPAFWMLGSDIDQVGWPRCGEIDIMENIGREPGTVHGTVHGPGYSGARGIGKAFVLPRGGQFASRFHRFALEWSPNRLEWFVDDHPYFTLTPKNLPRGAPWAFNTPRFILLNLAVGGAWPGPPDARLTFPRQMRVDYVRVYSKTAR